MSEPRPRFILREMFGKPYVRKVLQPDGTYRTAPPSIVVPPDVLAARRAFAEPYIAQAKAALMGKPITWRIQ
jgi:hypothetical protein